MKRLLSALAALAIALSVLAGPPIAARTLSTDFSQTLNTSSRTSDSLQTAVGDTGFTVVVSGTFVANWRLQASVDNGVTWVDYFVVDRSTLVAVPNLPPMQWRVSAAGGGDFTSGSATVSFLKGGRGSSHDRLINRDGTAVSSTNPLSVSGTVGVTGLPATGQAAMASSLPVAIASNQSAVSTTVSSALPAGSNLIGQVTVPATIRISATQTVTASSGYTSRNAVGGKITFSNAARVAAGGGVVQSCVLRDKAGQNVSYDLFLLDADPSATTVTDKSAVAINTADLGKVVGVVQFSGVVLGASSTMGVFTTPGLGLSFKLGSGTTLYGILAVTGTPTYASTSDVTVDCTILPD